MLGLKQPPHQKAFWAFALGKLTTEFNEIWICLLINEASLLSQCTIVKLQDAAHTTLNQMLFGFKSYLSDGSYREGGSLNWKQIKENSGINLHSLLDIVELGNKTSLERMFSLQVVEKLAMLEKVSGGSGETVVGFLKGMD